MVYEITNFYNKIKKPKKVNNPYYKKHKIEVPFRMLILGGTSSGKTNLAFNVVKLMKNTFQKLVICCKSKDEELYEYIEDELSGYVEFYENGEIPDIDSFEKVEGKYPETLIIFDDLIMVKDQSQITEYFIRGRKKNFSMMYLTHSYFATPKIIRLQCNYILLKKLNSASDLNIILRDFSLGISIDELKKLYEESTRDTFKDFFMIDLQGEGKLKFRKGFSKYLGSYS